jgi:hypothetical protein
MIRTIFGAAAIAVVADTCRSGLGAGFGDCGTGRGVWE